MDTDYISVTEISGDEVSQEQIERLCNRYYWVGEYCKRKDVVEVACGTGQGLGYLSSLANTIEGGDYSEAILAKARAHYGDRISLKEFDAQNMPFKDKSKDVIILLEAIYYLPDAEKFVRECVRILRPGGKVLIASANKYLFDFNPSPHSYKYYGVVELNSLFSKYGFRSEFFGDTPVDKVSIRQKILRPIKKLAVALDIMPKSMAGKKILKKIVFGRLVEMPAEIGPPIAREKNSSYATLKVLNPNKKPKAAQSNRSVYIEPDKISANITNSRYKVIYCVATLT